MRFKKPLDVLLNEAAKTGEGSLKRTLGAMNLVALGIGAITGAGLFVRTVKTQHVCLLVKVDLNVLINVSTMFL